MAQVLIVAAKWVESDDIDHHEHSVLTLMYFSRYLSSTLYGDKSKSIPFTLARRYLSRKLRVALTFAQSSHRTFRNGQCNASLQANAH